MNFEITPLTPVNPPESQASILIDGIPCGSFHAHETMGVTYYTTTAIIALVGKIWFDELRAREAITAYFEEGVLPDGESYYNNNKIALRNVSGGKMVITNLGDLIKQLELGNLVLDLAQQEEAL